MNKVNTICKYTTSALLFTIGAKKLFHSDKKVLRSLTIDLGNGECIWEDAQPLADADSFGTLFAGYPSGTMRLTYQMAEGITGVKVGDDFHLGASERCFNKALLKTQYPHLEGIWSWKDAMDQVVYVLRNPRWGFPSYHSLLYEIHYAHDWQTAYEYYQQTFQSRSPVGNWIKFRDYRIEEEIKMWAWHIDFYFEGGTQYWMEGDYERNGQYPYSFLPEEKDGYTRPKDDHCIYDLDCVPKAVLRFENLADPVKGPDELIKVANVIRGKKGFEDTISNEAVSCAYHGTLENHPMPANNDRDDSGVVREEFAFTYDQMIMIQDQIDQVRIKYSSGDWATDPVANDLVAALDDYYDELGVEISEMPVIHTPMNETYHAELLEWYKAIGRGDRYSKSAIQRGVDALDYACEEDPATRRMAESKGINCATQ